MTLNGAHRPLPQPERPDDNGGAWLLIRNGDGTYETARVGDPAQEPPPYLVSTRTIETSPWDEREIYTGGYDGAAQGRKNHSTAWIYRGGIHQATPRRSDA